MPNSGTISIGNGMGYTWVVGSSSQGYLTMGDGSNTVAGPPYRFGLQWQIGSSRVYLEMRAETQEAADESLRDVALGLAAKLEEWAQDRDRLLKPQMAADGGDLYRVGGE